MQRAPLHPEVAPLSKRHCAQCGLLALSRGDFFAYHIGGTDGLEISFRIASLTRTFPLNEG